jgi:FkbM family methyltransferase
MIGSPANSGLQAGQPDIPSPVRHPTGTARPGLGAHLQTRAFVCARATVTSETRAFKFSISLCEKSPDSVSDLLTVLYPAVVLRSILRTLSVGVVLKRRLPREFGSAPVFVSPDSALRYWRRDLRTVDPFLLSMARELVRPKMTVWDIGANVGLFSFAAASLGAQVVAVEADIWLANLIHRSVLMNKLPVTVLPAAVSDRPGITQLHLSDEGRSSNSLRGTGPVQTVVAVTLDSLLDHFPAPQVLKIDVEGMEYAVLSGARKVLQSRPLIFCEVTDHHDSIGQLLSAANYDFCAARSTDRQPLQRPSRDTLAIPRQP